MSSLNLHSAGEHGIDLDTITAFNAESRARVIDRVVIQLKERGENIIGNSELQSIIGRCIAEIVLPSKSANTEYRLGIISSLIAFDAVKLLRGDLGEKSGEFLICDSDRPN